MNHLSGLKDWLYFREADIFNYYAAGIDMGHTMHDVAIGDGIDGSIISLYLLLE
jgi:hypothetical protein